MRELRGYRVQVLSVPVGGRTYRLLCPVNPDALLDSPDTQARFTHDEYMPYWATLWPAAVLLAEQVARWDLPARPLNVLELGCGLGLVGLVAAGRGCRVTVSDYDVDALAFARANAAENGLHAPATRHIDWRQHDPDLRPDRILAADVLYESRNLVPIASFVARHLAPDGVAMVCDPNRATADAFPDIAREAGLAPVTREVTCRAADGKGMLDGRLFELRHDSDR